ncbi:MAG TPA: DUF2203 domain-containing protein [Phycisphaerae bacterium]|nr:DUF2203 domain-containing protein [Phycisphaerae bacterium]
MDGSSPPRWSRAASSTVGRKQKSFTLEEANRALPLVRRVVSDIVAQYKELLRLQPQREALLKSGRKAAAVAVKRQGTAIAERIDELIDELRGIGCDLKDHQAGLVDFPGRRNGREILLCWKPSEPNVMFWHEVHAGFSGRRPIDDACE